MGNQFYARQQPKIYPQMLFEESATQKLPLGTKWDTADGKGFIYCKNAAAGSVVIGKLVQSAAPVANDYYQAVQAAAALADTHVHITAGSSNLTLNQYKEGYLNTNDGNLYKVRGHAAITAAAAGVINLYDEIRTVLTTSSKYTLTYHHCAEVIIVPTTVSGKVIGVANITPTASYYFWTQYKGPAVCFVDTGDTLVIGDEVTGAPGTDAGGCTVAVETDINERIGVAYTVAQAGRYALINLNVKGI